ncbi:ATP-binding protein [Aliifodinibius salicampi]|uniref:histidine kinase n=1 Tax=Fodinibius salicampi TaxID=1920655 RepID=A0ABT3PVR7_9BACT|nr:two-component regulator propeller domain-containing protein [Fodinibius salicampi]MCW9711956.1 ATP-binding protein [Fodinibius salicampi]
MKKFFSFITILIGFLCIGTSIQGQNYRNIEFEHITQNEGLSQNNVMVIYQDHNGFMWFGTRNGLNRYDGYEFKHYQYNLTDTTTISGNDVRDILKDRDGNLWIATFSGLNKYNSKKDNFTRYTTDSNPYSISSNIVTSLYEDSEGSLWVGTDDGLDRIDRNKKNIIQYVHDPKDSSTLSHEHVTAIEKDNKGNLWIGTYRGLTRYNISKDAFTRYFYDSDNRSTIPHNRISALHKDTNGKIWIGTQGGGMAVYNSKTDDFTRYTHQEDSPNTISHNVILAINEDARGRLWIGTENGGLNIFDVKNNVITVFKENEYDEKSLGNDSIYAIYRDDKNNMWLGTYSGGVNFYDRNAKKFVHYHTQIDDDSSLNDNNIQEIDMDSEGNIWMATDGGGINKLDPATNNFTSYTHVPGQNSIAGNYVLSILVDQHDNVWAGTWGDGVSVLNTSEQTFTHYKHQPEDPNSLSLNNISDIYEDRRGDIWISTLGEGLNYLEGGDADSLIHYKSNSDNLNDPATISDDYPSLTYEDRRGNIWIGFSAVGLYLFMREEERFHHFYQQEGDSTSIRGKNIFDVLHDTKGRLWIGTDSGLNQFHYSDSTFSTFTTADGLPSNMIKSILEDIKGNLWLGTNEGLSKFNPKDSTFSNFSPDDGLQGNEFNSRSAVKSSNGRMYFGGLNGLNEFHPDSIRKNNIVPPVVITNFQVFNQDVPIGGDSPLQNQITEADNITLSHKQSVFSFKFAALNYSTPDKNEYAYKMEGFDEDWNYIGNQRNATYTNLDPGDYTFRVKAANNDGVWNEEGASVEVTITPPFWRTYAFYVFIGTFGVILFLGFYQWKVLSVRSRNEQLEEKVAERTAELHEKNSDLEEALTELKETRSQLVEKARKAGMADIATGVLHNVGNILNSVNTSASVIEETAQKSELHNLYQANDLLKKNINQVEDFILNSSKGKKLLSYYLKLEDPLKKEQKKVLEQSKRLNKKINLIKEVIAAQQSYASASMEADQMSLEEMIDDALSLQSGSIERHDLTIEKELNAIDAIKAHRTQLIHILVNLFKNAKEAVADNDFDDKVITIKTWQDEDNVYLTIADNGYGIKEKNIDKIFTQGFTTKKDGHGFGLHSCANYMQSMGGDIRVESDGKGAAFTLVFPRIPNDTEGTDEGGAAP